VSYRQMVQDLVGGHCVYGAFRPLKLTGRVSRPMPAGLLKFPARPCTSTIRSRCLRIKDGPAQDEGLPQGIPAAPALHTAGNSCAGPRSALSTRAGLS